MKIIEFNFTLNTRDLGGYQNQAGQVIKDHRFLRSDSLSRISPEEKDWLLTRGVTTTIDLRTPRIAAKYPSALRDDARFTYHNIPIVEGSDVPLDEAHIPELYMAMLAHHDTFNQIMNVIISAPGGIIYHCSAGKDRTGMVTFLLLELVGIHRDVITADYALSSTLIDKKLPIIRESDPTFPTFLGYSKPEYFQMFYPLFDAKYGSITNYFTQIGINDKSRQILKTKLLGN